MRLSRRCSHVTIVILAFVLVAGLIALARLRRPPASCRLNRPKLPSFGFRAPITPGTSRTKQ